MSIATNRPLLGAVWMLTFCAVATLGDTMVRIVTLGGFPTIQAVFIRSSAGALVLLPFVLANKSLPIARPVMKTYLWRGFFAFLGATSWFYLLKYAEFTSLVAIGFTAPLFAALLAVLFLGERMSLPKAGAFLLGFFGALVVINPLGMSFNVYLVMAVGSALLWAISLIFAKQLSRTENPITVAFFFALFSVPVSLIMSLPGWHWPTNLEWIYLMAFVACGTVAQISLAKAFSYAEITALMPLEYSMLLFAAMYSYFVFGDIASINTVVGGAIILISGYLIVRRPSVKKRAVNKDIHAQN